MDAPPGASVDSRGRLSLQTDPLFMLHSSRKMSPFLRLAKSRLRRLLACTRLRAQSSDPASPAHLLPGRRGCFATVVNNS